jgi:hypothetical protein
MNTGSHFNVLAYVVSGIVYFLVGWLWYSNALFAKQWTKETGVHMGQGQGRATVVLPMVGQLVSTFLYTLGISMVVMLGNFADVKGALVAAASIIGFFVLPVNSGTLFFRNKPLLFCIDSGYQAVGAIVLALILALWK